MVTWVQPKPSGGGGTLEWSRVTWQPVNLTSGGLAAEIFTTSGDIEHMVGSCCSVNGSNRLTFDYAGTYMVVLQSELGTFTPSGTTRWDVLVEVRDSGGALVGGSKHDYVPLIGGLTNSSPTSWLTVVEPADVGTTFRLFGAQNSGSTRSHASLARVVYLG